MLFCCWSWPADGFRFMSFILLVLADFGWKVGFRSRDVLIYFLTSFSFALSAGVGARSGKSISLAAK